MNTRQAMEQETLDEILKVFGETVEVTENGRTTEVAIVATSFEDSARYLSDPSTYTDFAGESHHGITVQFTWSIEVKKSDWAFGDDAIVRFRNENYQIVSRNETDVSTYRIFLLED